jgi:uncharacterized protein YdaU (DUF1376 family)
MNWYSHYIGDYSRDTGHLSLVEEGAFRRLLDCYYATEKPLHANASLLHRVCRAHTDEERAAVDRVVAEFFILGPDGYHNQRADLELSKSKHVSEKRAKSAKKRWDANAMQMHMQKPCKSHAYSQPQPHIKTKPIVKPVFCPDCQGNGTKLDHSICHCEKGKQAQIAREVLGRITGVQRA